MRSSLHTEIANLKCIADAVNTRLLIHCDRIVRSASRYLLRRGAEETNEGKQTAQEGLVVLRGEGATSVDAASVLALHDQGTGCFACAVALRVVSNDVIVAARFLAHSKTLSLKADKELLKSGATEERINGSTGVGLAEQSTEAREAPEGNPFIRCGIPVELHVWTGGLVR